MRTPLADLPTVNVRPHRLRAGMSQTDLAYAVNVTPNTVALWEKGRSPNARLLPLIADALGVEINDLYA